MEIPQATPGIEQLPVCGNKRLPCNRTAVAFYRDGAGGWMVRCGLHDAEMLDTWQRLGMKWSGCQQVSMEEYLILRVLEM